MKNTVSLMIISLIVGGTASAVWLNRETTLEASNPLPQAPSPDTVAVREISRDSIVLPPPSDSLLITESITHKNLQIFFIRTGTEIPGVRYLTLDKALKSKMVRVKETEDVNELKADNKSSDYIYINSGDIVRGGKQDRTIQYDVILAPGARNINLASFCVEHDRWHSRGDENVSTFNSSTNTLSSKDLKVAAKLEKDQSAVWAEVEEYQVNANANISGAYSWTNVDVKSLESASSLELTLENKTIKKINQEYKEAIMAKIGLSKNASGIACFINGKLASIDLYNNHALFEDLLNKLLDAAIAEAISENATKKYTAVTETDVRRYIVRSSKQRSREYVNKCTLFKVAEAGGKLLKFTTDDRQVNLWLHKNWLEQD